ncbi:serine-rich adhesin for platelets-like [Mytilus edulis]|uniref:serine-rich adhesin for platelets-like n=1 Tax=Mytilus edulis TaxID=6550 RepID=UPI0039F0F551
MASTHEGQRIHARATDWRFTIVLLELTVPLEERMYEVHERKMWPRLTALYHIENEQNNEAERDAPVEGCNNTPVLPPGPGGFYRYYVHPDDIRSSRRSMSAYSMSQQSIAKSPTKKVPCCGICLGTMLIFSFAAIISVSVVLSILWTEPHVVSQTTENGTGLSTITDLELLKSKEKNISKEVCTLMKSALERNNITSPEKQLHNCSISLTKKKGFMHMVLLLETGNNLIKGDIAVDNGIPKVKLEEQSVTVFETTTKQPISTSTSKQDITTIPLTTTTEMKEPDSVLVLSSEEVKHLRNIFDGNDGSLNPKPMNFGHSIFDNNLLSGLSGNDFNFFSNDLKEITTQETTIEENNNNMSLMEIIKSNEGSETQTTETENKTSLLDTNDQAIPNIKKDEDNTSMSPDPNIETTLVSVSVTDKLSSNKSEENIQNGTEDSINFSQYETKSTENETSNANLTEIPMTTLSTTIKTTESISSTMYNYGHDISFPAQSFSSHAVHEQPYRDMTTKRAMIDNIITTETPTLENVDSANVSITRKSYSNIKEPIDVRLKMDTNLEVSASVHAESENKTHVQELNVISNVSDINEFNETEFSNTTFIRTKASKDDPKKSTKQNMKTNTSVNGLIITNLTDKGSIYTTSEDSAAKHIQNVYGTKLKIVSAQVSVTVVDTIANESIPMGNLSNNGLSPVDNKDTNTTSNTDSNSISSSIASSNTTTTTNDTITKTIDGNITAVRNFGKTAPNITKTSSVDTNTTTTTNVNNSKDKYPDVSHKKQQKITEVRNVNSTGKSDPAIKADEVLLMVTKHKTETSTQLSRMDTNATSLDDDVNFMSNNTMNKHSEDQFNISTEYGPTVADISNATLEKIDDNFGNTPTASLKMTFPEIYTDSLDQYYVHNDTMKTNITYDETSNIIQSAPTIITEEGTTDSNMSTEVNTTSVDNVSKNITNFYRTKLKIVNAEVTVTVVDTVANESINSGVLSNNKHQTANNKDTQMEPNNTNKTISSDTPSNATSTNDSIADTIRTNTSTGKSYDKTTLNTMQTDSDDFTSTNTNVTTNDDFVFMSNNILVNNSGPFNVSINNDHTNADILNVTFDQNDDAFVNASTTAFQIKFRERSNESLDEHYFSNDIMERNITYKKSNTNNQSHTVIEGNQTNVSDRLFSLDAVNVTGKIKEQIINLTNSNMTLNTEINWEIEKENTVTNASSSINDITAVANSPQAYALIKDVIETDEKIANNGTSVTHNINETDSYTHLVHNFTLDAANWVVESNITDTLLILPGKSMTNVTEQNIIKTNSSTESNTKTNFSLSDSLLPLLMTEENSLNHSISTIVKLENKTDSLINSTILGYVEKLNNENPDNTSSNITLPVSSNRTLPLDGQIIDERFNNMTNVFVQDSHENAQANLTHNLNNKTGNLTARSDQNATNNLININGTTLKVLSADMKITVVDATANESIQTDDLTNDVLTANEYKDGNTTVLNNTTTGVSIPIEIRAENSTSQNVINVILINFEGENITLLRNVSKLDVQIHSSISNDRAEEIINNTLVNNTTVENRNYFKRNATVPQYEASNNSLPENLTMEPMPAADNNLTNVENEYSTNMNSTINSTVSIEQTNKTHDSSAISLDPNAKNVNTLSLTGNITDYIEESTNASAIEDREQNTVSNIKVNNNSKSMLTVLSGNKIKHVINTESAEGTISNSTVHEIQILRDTVKINDTTISSVLVSNVTQENNSVINNDMFHSSVLTDNSTDITESSAVNVTIQLQHITKKSNESERNLTIPRDDSVEDNRNLINNSSLLATSAVNITVPDNGSIVNMDTRFNLSKNSVDGLTNVSLLVNNTVVNLTSSVAMSVRVNGTRLDDITFNKRSNITVSEMSTSSAPTKVDATELTDMTNTSETNLLYINPLNVTVQNTTRPNEDATKVEQVIYNGTTTTTDTTTIYAPIPSDNTDPTMLDKPNTTVLYEGNTTVLSNTETSTIQSITQVEVKQVGISTDTTFIIDTQPSKVISIAPSTILPSTKKSDVSTKPSQTSTTFQAMSTSRFTVKRSITNVTKKPTSPNYGLSSKANVSEREGTTASKRDTTTKATKLQTGGFNSGSNSFFLFDVNLLGQNAFPFSNLGGK